MNTNDLPVEVIKSCIAKFNEGESGSMDDVISFYKDPLYSLCIKLTLNYQDADDLFQQSWFKAMRNINKFKGQSFKAWLFAICSNQYKDDYRRKKRSELIINDKFTDSKIKDFVLNSQTPSISAEDEYLNYELRCQLLKNIQTLSPKLKIPIVLFYFHEYTYEEISEMLHLPKGTIKSRMNSAKNKLKDTMEVSNV